MTDGAEVWFTFHREAACLENAGVAAVVSCLENRSDVLKCHRGLKGDSPSEKHTLDKIHRAHNT